MIDLLLSLLWQLRYKTKPSDLVVSELHNEATFYKKFLQDLKTAKTEVIIESPYITTQRMKQLKPAFVLLVKRKIKVYLLTRDPDSHDEWMRTQAEQGIKQCQLLGIQVVLNSQLSHRKLAIIDRQILWEGSLNILSQCQSQEIMRRIDSQSQATACFSFIGLSKYVY
jgi:hypothetical protein